MANNTENKEEFSSQLIDVRRVVRVTAGGRQFRFRAAVAIGNKQGKVGMKVAKGNDLKEAIEKATNKAKKNLTLVPLEEGTIPCKIETNFKSVTILLRPQKKGRGITAGGTMRVICELAGIEDITGKLLSRGNNKINVAKATLKAFQELNKLLEKQKSLASSPSTKESAVTNNK